MKRRDDEIALTANMIAALKAEKARTSMGPQALLKGRDDVPKGLNHAIITHWLGGRVKTAERAHFEFAMEAWKAAPDNPTVEITPEMHRQLVQAHDRSGMTPEMIIRWRPDRPEGLTVGRLKSILSGNTRSIGQAEWRFLMGVLESGAQVNDGS